VFAPLPHFFLSIFEKTPLESAHSVPFPFVLVVCIPRSGAGDFSGGKKIGRRKTMNIQGTGIAHDRATRSEKKKKQKKK
jgi:hypothetical protein